MLSFFHFFVLVDVFVGGRLDGDRKPDAQITSCAT